MQFYVINIDQFFCSYLKRTQPLSSRPEAKQIMSSYAKRVLGLKSLLGHPRKSKRSKYSYVSEEWFDSLSKEELKQLCQAAKIKVSGNQRDLIKRLDGDERTKMYGVATRQKCVDMCRDRFLSVAGNKLCLAIRILTHDSGVAANTCPIKIVTLLAEKDERNTDPAVGTNEKATLPLSTHTLYEMVEKLVLSVKTIEKYSSTEKENATHAPDVYTLMQKLIHQECIEKGLLEHNPSQALESAEAVIMAFNDRFEHMEYPANGHEDFLALCESLNEVIEGVKTYLSLEQIEATMEWLEELFVNVDRFNIGAENLVYVINLLDADWHPSSTAANHGTPLLRELRDAEINQS